MSADRTTIILAENSLDILGTWKISGTAVTATATELNLIDGVTATTVELNILDGVTSTTSELDEYAITVRITDISTAGSVWVVAPHAGDISKIYSVIDGAITVGDAVLDPQIATVSVTNGGITIANAGSAAGDVDSSTPTAANTVTAGQAIEIATDGGSTDTAAATITILIAR